MLPFAIRSPRVGRVAQALALLVAGLSFLGLVLKVLPGFDQANVQVIALALPAHLGVAAGLAAEPLRVTRPHRGPHASRSS